MPRCMPAPPYAVVSPQRNLHYKQVGGDHRRWQGRNKLPATGLRYFIPYFLNRKEDICNK